MDEQQARQEIGALADELAELRELANLAPRFLATAAEQAGRRVERMTRRPPGSHQPEKIERAREELAEAARALELARKWSPTRRAILAKVGAPS